MSDVSGGLTAQAAADSPSQISAESPGQVAAKGLTRTPPSGDEVKRLAQEFEAMLVTQMLRDLRRSLVSFDDNDNESRGLGAETMSDVADLELGRALSRAGGFGLVDSIFRTLERQAGASAKGTTEAPAREHVTRVTGSRDSDSRSSDTRDPGTRDASRNAGFNVAQTVGIPEADRHVTSRFGWRRDPLNGGWRFHQGVDLAMAYGEPVHAAADGRVTFAGTRGSFGQLVVIDHGGGQVTRYAHLSEHAVEEGDVVTAGQVIGKAGDSGRTTGPHLHFETLSGGQAVEPRALPRRTD